MRDPLIHPCNQGRARYLHGDPISNPNLRYVFARFMPFPSRGIMRGRPIINRCRGSCIAKSQR